MTRCKVCKSEFKKWRMSQKVCFNPDCAQKWAEIERLKQEMRELRQRRRALKRKSEWAKEAQFEFNRYIRERDRDLPCISCGRFHTGSYDAGHYRSVGAAPHLRFNEDNCHKQCVPCNHHKAGNAVEYRIRLLGRIGPDRVGLLETSNEIRKFTIQELAEIKETYRKKWKALVASRNKTD